VWFLPQVQTLDQAKQMTGFYLNTFANSFVIRGSSGRGTCHVYNIVGARTQNGFLVDEAGHDPFV
jgi:hypothetical protein